jgi:hypothetical protein
VNRRWLRAGAQIALIGGAIVFLVQTARRHTSELSAWDASISWPPLLAASLLVLAAFVFMVATWSASLRWWNTAVPVLPALRIWSLSNLARFIPGGIWQFAGLAALAAEEGVSPVAATGAVLLQQIVLLATGIVVAATLAPAWIAPFAGGLPPWATITLTLTGLALLIVVIPASLQPLSRRFQRLVRRDVTLPRPTTRSFASYVLALVMPWVAYAVAFWLFALAMLNTSTPTFLVAGGAFVASYVVGILAVFAPAGIAVREAALVAMLTPAIDARSALVLAIGSRLWMIVLEIVMALVVIGAYRSRRTAPRESP